MASRLQRGVWVTPQLTHCLEGDVWDSGEEELGLEAEEDALEAGELVEDDWGETEEARWL